MVLKNILILRGSYQDIKAVKEELEKLSKNKKQSDLYNIKNTRFIKKIKIYEEEEYEYLYNLKVTFNYKKDNIRDFIDSFNSFNVEIIHMCDNLKKDIWIVNKHEYIKKYKLIPFFALNDIFLDYMNYKESSIILDSFETLKYDRNDKLIVIDDKKANYDELLDILYNKTIKGKIVYDIFEQFINNYYEKCINNYNELYSINSDKESTEEPSPLALFIVTFGIFALIGVLLKVMGYF